MPDLIEEIKEDIKQEKLEKFWKDTGNYIIGGIVLIIAATAGNVAYKSYVTNKYESLGTKLYSAYNSESANNKEKAITGYDSIAKNSDSSISAIANMRQASLLAEEGKKNDATQIYKDISDNRKNPIEIRQLAEILYLKNAIKFTEKKDISLINRLEDISKSEGPFKHSAKEMLAFILYDNMEYVEAKQLFKELSEEEFTPSRMRNRAMEMVGAIKIKNEDANG
jgi:hypothetical protein